MTPACGTDSGYYHHRRKLLESACDDCKHAHAVAERLRAHRHPKTPKTLCECGRRMLNISFDTCSHCRKAAARKSPIPMVRVYDDPVSGEPVKWVRKGLIYVKERAFGPSLQEMSA